MRLLKSAHLEDYSIKMLFEIKFFCKWINKIQGSTYATVKNFRVVQTYQISQETALKFMNVISLFAQNLGIFCFQKKVVIR